MKEKVMVRDLRPGMFVYELDRPWLDTPYLLQGFLVETREDVEELAKYCEYVYIDAVKGQLETQPRHGARDVSQLEASSATPVHTGFHGQEVYRDARPVEAELEPAKASQHAAADIVESIAVSMQSGLKIDFASVKDAVEGLRESIVRNPDALMLLCRIRDIKSSDYRRAIDVSVYLLAFGRELGLSKDDLTVLGLGGLLLDVGKLRLPPELLNKDVAYTPQEYMVMKRHVAYGESMLRDIPNMSEGVMRMVTQHHEREDGSGYPRGLAFDQISAFGRMAGIVDCYVELVSPRSQGFPVSTQEALQMLHGWSGRHFHPALVEVFIRCIGVFPAGSLVELNTGEVGIVLSHNRASRLRPRLLLVLDPKKARYASPKTVDLAATPANEFGIQYEIGRALEFGMYGVHPKDYLL